MCLINANQKKYLIPVKYNIYDTHKIIFYTFLSTYLLSKNKFCNIFLKRFHLKNKFRKDFLK